MNIIYWSVGGNSKRISADFIMRKWSNFFYLVFRSVLSYENIFLQKTRGNNTWKAVDYSQGFASSHEKQHLCGKFYLNYNFLTVSVPTKIYMFSQIYSLFLLFIRLIIAPQSFYLTAHQNISSSLIRYLASEKT